jgi:holin-like protein
VKYIQQFLIILGFTFAGEVLNRLIPLPIPAAIYGLILLFLALASKLLPLEAIRETALFLIAIMPMLFVAPVVNLLDVWDQIVNDLLPILILIVATTILTFAAAGLVTQTILKRQPGGDRHD